MVERIAMSELGDADWIIGALTHSWGSPVIVVNEEAIDATACPALVAHPRQGLLVFRETADQGVEVIAIEAFVTGQGIGRSLLDRLVMDARHSGKRHVSATTTNDNLAAPRFYQTYGFRLFALRAGAVDRARQRLKPEIPENGADGLPIRDEIELRYTL